MRFTFRHTRYCCYASSVSHAAVNNLAPLLFLTFQRQFGITLSQLALLVSLNFAIQMLVDLVCARYAVRVGYRTCVVGANALCGLGLIGLGVLPYAMPGAYAGVVCAMVLYALGGGLLEVLTSPIVEAMPGEEKAAAMSMLHSFYCWGHVAVVLLSTLYFVTVGIERWRFLPMLWAVLPLANACVFSRVPINTFGAESATMPMRSLLRMPVFWLFFALMLCAGAAEQGMSQWASLFAEQGLRVSKTLGDLLGPCAFAVLMGLSRLLYGRSGSRLNLRACILASSVLCVGCYLLTAFSPGALLPLLGCAVCGFSVGILWPGTLSLSAARCPQGGTALFALLALAGDIGCSVGPGLVGWVSDWWLVAGGVSSVDAIKLGLLAAAVFPLLLAGGALLLRRHTH